MKVYPAETIIARARDAYGVSITLLNEDKMRVAPASRVTDQMRAVIQFHKHILLRYLREESKNAPVAETCVTSEKQVMDELIITFGGEFAEVYQTAAEVEQRKQYVMAERAEKNRSDAAWEWRFKNR
jgi:hypothetical protein